MLGDGVSRQVANHVAADGVIAAKRESSKAASKARRQARYGVDADEKRNRELAAAALAVGRIPKGWRGAQEVRRRGRAEFELWQTWRTIQAFMSVYGISEEEAVEQFGTRVQRLRARAVLAEMRR
jgi:hypothetical protein